VPILHLDTGGFSKPTSYGLEIKARTILYSYARMGVRAVNVATKDLMALKDYYFTLEKESEIKFLSANVVDKESGEPLFTPYIIEKVGETTVAIVGATEASPIGLQPIGGHNVEILDPIKTVKPLLAKLSEEADVVVLMLYYHFARLRSVAGELRDADIVLGADGFSTTWREMRLGSTHVSYGGRQGQKLMLLKAAMRNDILREVDQEIVTMKLALPEDTTIKAVVDAAQREIENTKKTPSFTGN
jgi:2',3'-cyclic-nucleotide 2'-phosphodiesterase (5'-nucleotidase family)